MREKFIHSAEGTTWFCNHRGQWYKVIWDSYHRDWTLCGQDVCSVPRDVIAIQRTRELREREQGRENWIDALRREAQERDPDDWNFELGDDPFGGLK